MTADQGAREAAEERLRDWRARKQQVDDDRDQVVLAALGAGISKNRIHVLTGIARTTVYDIEADSPGSRPSGTSYPDSGARLPVITRRRS